MAKHVPGNHTPWQCYGASTATGFQTALIAKPVPVQSHSLNGMDSLLSIAQMPAGIPVGTLAIGKAGATNAALFAIQILANTRPDLRDRLRRFRVDQERQVREATLP